jgi:adenylosuccinate synthase
MYEEYQGWDQDVTGIRKWDDLPKNAQRYIQAIEHHTGVPVEIVSVGPEREQVVVRSL